MPVHHVVRQGEHLSSIAEKYDFRDYRAIWEDPQNADLAAIRDPNVLYPGDDIVIPDKTERTEARYTGDTYVFRILIPRLKLRIRALDLTGKPLANTPCQLEVEDDKADLQTDDNGILEHEISAKAVTGVLRIADMEYDLKIGHLDPADEDEGLHARLNNLGYYVDAIDEPDPELVEFAIELFQWDNQLSVDGSSTPDLVSKLKDTYGC